MEENNSGMEGVFVMLRYLLLFRIFASFRNWSPCTTKTVEKETYFATADGRSKKGRERERERENCR